MDQHASFGRTCRYCSGRLWRCWLFRPHHPRIRRQRCYVHQWQPRPIQGLWILISLSISPSLSLLSSVSLPLSLMRLSSPSLFLSVSNHSSLLSAPFSPCLISFSFSLFFSFAYLPLSCSLCFTSIALTVSLFLSLPLSLSISLVHPCLLNVSFSRATMFTKCFFFCLSPSHFQSPLLSLLSPSPIFNNSFVILFFMYFYIKMVV